MRSEFERLVGASRVQSRIILAVMLRDMMMRYGRGNIGFVWVILEPMLLTAGVMVIWTLTMGGDKYGIKLVEFILTGYMPLTLWRHLTNSMVMLFRRSVPLLYHRRITLFDIIVAKLSLEFVGTTAAFLAVWGTLYLAGIVAGVASLELLIVGWLMMFWLGSASALIIAVVTETSEAVEKFVQPVQYLIIPVSGAFAMVDWVPPWAQDALLLNPMVHCYEVVRAGYFGDGVITYYWPGYFFASTFILTAIGVVCLRRIRVYIQV